MWNPKLTNARGQQESKFILISHKNSQHYHFTDNHFKFKSKHSQNKIPAREKAQGKASNCRQKTQIAYCNPNGK